MPQSIPHHAHGASSARFGRLVRFSIASAVALAVAGMSTSALAQPAPAVADGADVENSKFTTTGIIQSNAVFVRCGPGDNYYPTMKLDKGVKVKVVGARFDWLKVVPPEGSFCYVAKLYVDRHGVGQVGRVNKDSINVRAGSSLSALKIG
ncbi:MAG: SH3 domain-containing protein, partial [Phycisphaerae bacterium]